MGQISVLTVAAAVQQFVQSTQSLISDGYQLSNSPSGLTQRHDDLKDITSSLRGLSTGIQRCFGNLGSRDKELETLCNHCNEVAQELLAILDELSVQKGASR
jgi:hypothetical protein